VEAGNLPAPQTQERLMQSNSSHEALPSGRPKLLLSGLDSLYVSYFLDTSAGKLDWDELAYRKERIRNSRTDAHTEIVLGTQRFALLPYGRKPYPYVLANKSFEIRLAEHMRPNCHVQIFSEALWKAGADFTLASIEEWFGSMRFLHTRPNVVSRADWAFDYHLPSLDFAWDDFVSAAAKDSSWRKHRKTETFVFGVGDPVIRVYDKAAEIKQESGKTWFYELWGRTDKVWRIEFQARRERLDLAGINNTSDIGCLQGDLLRELAQRHTTLRVPSGDSNRSRWLLHRLWQALIEDISALPQTGLVRDLDPLAPIEWRLHQTTKSLYGTLKAIAALRQIKSGASEPLSLDNILVLLWKLLPSHHDAAVWKEEIARRVADYGLGRW
jgi:hypothetical protein